MRKSWVWLLSAGALSAQLDFTALKELKYRNIGPFRGGRAVAVAGVTSQPFTYFFGATGGGIWKTTDSGATWQAVSDGQLKSGSVGGLAVSESDPNVIYAEWGRPACAATRPMATACTNPSIAAKPIVPILEDFGTGGSQWFCPRFFSRGGSKMQARFSELRPG